VSAIAELADERIVEGTYAVARKQRLRTRNGHWSITRMAFLGFHAVVIDPM